MLSKSIEKYNDLTHILIYTNKTEHSELVKKYIDENANNKEYKNYIEYKVNKINNLLFNNQNKIIKDITTAIENDSKNDKENNKQ